MTTAASPDTTTTTDEKDDYDDLWHISCKCQRNAKPGTIRALCGKRLAGITAPYEIDPSELCNVCDDLRTSREPRPCCGYVRPY